MTSRDAVSNKVIEGMLEVVANIIESFTLAVNASGIEVSLLVPWVRRSLLRCLPSCRLCKT